MDLSNLQKKIKSYIAEFPGRISYKIESEDQFIQKDAAEGFQAASLIKIPIIMEGFRQIEEGKIHLNERAEISDSDLAGGSGVLQALSKSGFTIEDMLTLMIIVSDNTATNMLIRKLGINCIHQTIASLNLKKSVLGRYMMDFDAIGNGFDNYTCADDMVTCLRSIHQGSFLSGESRQHILRIMEKQQLISKLPAMMNLNEVTVASKNGAIPGAEHDSAIITRGDVTVYAAVLTDSLENEEDGRRIISQIGRYIYEEMMLSFK
jgi:beta-lactamase class A